MASNTEPVPGESGKLPGSLLREAGNLASQSPRTTWGLVFNGDRRDGSTPQPETAKVVTESGSPRRWWQFWKSGKAETPRNTEPTMPEVTQPPPIIPRP